MKYLNILICISLVVLFSDPSAGKVMEASFKGYLQNGVDTSGVFGSPVADISGHPYEVVFRYNTALGNRGTNPGYSDEVFGVSPFSAGNANISATVAVDDHIFLLKPVTLYVYNVQSFDVLYDIEFSDIFETESFRSIEYNIHIFAGFLDPDPSLDRSIPAFVTNNGGSFSIINYNQNAAIYDQYAIGQFGPGTFEVSPVPDVQIWLYMILGMGSVGLLFRVKNCKIPLPS